MPPQKKKRKINAPEEKFEFRMRISNVVRAAYIGVVIDREVQRVVFPDNCIPIQTMTRNKVPKHPSIPERFRQQTFRIDKKDPTRATYSLEKRGTVCHYKEGKFVVNGSSDTKQTQTQILLALVCQKLSRIYQMPLVVTSVKITNFSITIYPEFQIDHHKFHYHHLTHSELEKKSFPGVHYKQQLIDVCKRECPKLHLIIFPHSVILTGFTNIKRHAIPQYKAKFGHQKFYLRSDNGQLIKNAKYDEIECELYKIK
jgi:TATA-box binding protein (TBP) (component of TFIID and TFIIIB)